MPLQTGATVHRARRAKEVAKREKTFSPGVNKYVWRQQVNPERTHVKVSMAKRRILADGLEEWTQWLDFDVEAKAKLSFDELHVHAREVEKKQAESAAAAAASCG